MCNPRFATHNTLLLFRPGQQIDPFDRHCVCVLHGAATTTTTADIVFRKLKRKACPKKKKRGGSRAKNANEVELNHI